MAFSMTQWACAQGNKHCRCLECVAANRRRQLSEEELAQAVASHDISAAWAGGTRGRRILDRMLPALDAALSPRGVFYLLGVAENDFDEIAQALREQAGLEVKLIAERRAQNERLWVMRASRQYQ